MKRDWFKVALLTSTTWKSDKYVQMWMHSIFKPEALAYGVDNMGRAVISIK